MKLLEVQRWWEEEGSGWAEIVGWLEEIEWKELRCGIGDGGEQSIGGKKFHH